MVTVLFATTLFCSALLLFTVQPLLGKLLLPLAGGAPAVWNTCLVFFQTALLAGYLYAHRFTARLSTRVQVACHLTVLLLVAGVVAACHLSGSALPVVASLVPAEQDYPFLPLLALLTLAVGVPFVGLSATAPLLQRWYATLEANNRDPYFLYAASNAGSLLGLIGYPFLIEPTLSLTTQRSLWAAGVGACLVLLAACAVITARHAPALAPAADTEGPAVPAARVLRWVALAAVPSALLNAATVNLTTDLAPVPLLWVVPLALYLLSFVLVFAWWPDWLHRATGRAVPILLAVTVFLVAFGATEPIEVVAGAHMLTLFGACLLCHGELARDRPEKGQLTRFYLWMAAGGVCGSLFGALLAPQLFARLGLVEYPLVLVLVALVRPFPRDGETVWPVRPGDLLWPAALAGLAVGLVVTVPDVLGQPPAEDHPGHFLDRYLRGGLMFGVPAVLAYALAYRPGRYALALAAVLLAARLDHSRHGAVLLTTRNFFGTLRVTRSPDGRFHRLVHGTTQHGQERLEDDCPPVPLMYYHPTGPAGRVLRALPEGRLRRVGVVGLGSGALASYAKRGQKWTFFEIDPAVARIAEDARWFRYLACCPGEVTVVLGDARRRLQEKPAAFDLLVLDAFSSDAIPTHLLTREALELYLERLAPGGLLLFHVSNRYLDLPPVLARAAAAIDPSLVVMQDNDAPSPGEREAGKTASVWVLIARRAEDLGPVAKDLRWARARAGSGEVWTDDFSNLLGAWKWE